MILFLQHRKQFLGPSCGSLQDRGGFFLGETELGHELIQQLNLFFSLPAIDVGQQNSLVEYEIRIFIGQI